MTLIPVGLHDQPESAAPEAPIRSADEAREARLMASLRGGLRMGRMIYESSVRLDVDDRTLAHLVVVMSSKLRRGESFHFSWRNDPSVGDGRTTIWVHPRSSLVFEFGAAGTPAYNAAWLERLSVAANSPEGLLILPEPDPDAETDVAAQLP